MEFWQLDRTAGTGDANVSLYWENVAYSGIDDCTDLEIARWNGSTWVRHDATSVSGSSCTGSGTGTILTNAVVTAFSPFTFGSTSASVNALPIQLSSFESECNMSGVELSWITQTENNNAEFVVERSLDGSSFTETGRLKGAGNSKAERHYSFTDDQPAVAIVYYRLRMIDSFGGGTFSPIISVNCLPHELIKVFPNPGERDFTVSGLRKGAHIRVTNTLGQTVLEEITGGTSHKFQLDAKGVYVLTIPETNLSQSFKIIVR